VFLVPLEGLVQISHALAGKTTGVSLTVSVVVSLSISAALAGTIVKLMTKSRRDDSALDAQRGIIQGLEGELAACKEASSS
jgi:hypothetical protein